jgi:hypothetical protein
MPIFGQVWLWSSLAFLLGAVLCWLLVARPARNRVGELESQLATRARRQAVPERAEQGRRHDDDADFARSMVPGLGDRQVDEASEYLTRAYALPRESPPPLLAPDRGRLAQYAEPDSMPGPTREFAPMPPMPEPEQAFSAFGARQELDERDTELADQPPATATQYIDVSAGSLTAPPEVPAMSPPPSNRSWFDDELDGDSANQAPEDQPAVPRNRHHIDAEEEDPFDSRLVDDEPGIGHALDEEHEAPRSAIEDDGGTVFTQRTHPIPGELIRQIDEAGKNEQQSDGFVDDLEDDPHESEPERRERTVESEPVEPPPVEEVAASVPEPDLGASNGLTRRDPEVSAPPELPQEQTEVVAAAVVRETANELPRRVPKQSKMIAPEVAVRVEPTPNALPKRVPGKPRHQVPFGVQPTQEPAPAAAAVSAPVQEALVPDSPRSLFEPIVPAADEGAPTPPPPHRLRQASGGGRGPFGPGSAMPLPGGASPSPEFTIKASVAALRYCAPESPQFGRTVAEVWFRTAADAERVGFRPVG